MKTVEQYQVSHRYNALQAEYEATEKMITSLRVKKARLRRCLNDIQPDQTGLEGQQTLDFPELLRIRVS